jgi:hypothetical protein
VARFIERIRSLPPAVQALVAACLALVAAAELDLQRRPADQVRGAKALWRVACLNALGAAAYFRWGRRT